MSAECLHLAASTARTSILSSRSTVLSTWQRTKLPRQCWASRRHVHMPTPLLYDIEQGLGQFLPPYALRVVAVDRQQGLLRRLNEAVKGTEQENKSVVQTVIDTASSTENALAFNYASHALNNSYFLSSLKPPEPGYPNHEHHLEQSGLYSSFRDAMGTFDHFKSFFISVATGMSGSGYVWLVVDNRAQIAVVPTFAAGSLLVRSRSQLTDTSGSVLYEPSRKQLVYEPASVRIPMETLATRLSETATVHVTSSNDAAFTPSPAASDASLRDASSVTSPTDEMGQTPSSPVSGLSHSPSPLHPSSPSRTLHTSSLRASLSDGNDRAVPDSIYNMFSSGEPEQPVNDQDRRPLGDELYPLFCISVHEHCWMSAGFGVWGKERWLTHFWDVLDWKTVVDRYHIFITTHDGKVSKR